MLSTRNFQRIGSRVHVDSESSEPTTEVANLSRRAAPSLSNEIVRAGPISAVGGRRLSQRKRRAYSTYAVVVYVSSPLFRRGHEVKYEFSSFASWGNDANGIFGRLSAEAQLIIATRDRHRVDKIRC